MKRPIMNLSSRKDKPPRVFDVIVEGNDVQLEVKTPDALEVIPWEEVKYQVEAAKRAR